MAEPPARRSGGRALALGVLGGVACGGIALAAAGRPWAQVEVVAPGVPRTLVEVSGSSVVPWVSALALVMLTASLALLPTGGRLRQAVAGLLALASAGVAGGSLLAGSRIGDSLRRDLVSTPAAAGLDVNSLAGGADQSLWRWVALAAGLAGVALGVWACTCASGWPVMGSRYEAPAAGGAGSAGADGSETDLWRAMDRGEDPT